MVVKYTCVTIEFKADWLPLYHGWAPVPVGSVDLSTLVGAGWGRGHGVGSC